MVPGTRWGTIRLPLGIARCFHDVAAVLRHAAGTNFARLVRGVDQYLVSCSQAGWTRTHDSAAADPLGPHLAARSRQPRAAKDDITRLKTHQADDQDTLDLMRAFMSIRPESHGSQGFALR
jgi:hypothetical protein